MRSGETKTGTGVPVLGIAGWKNAGKTTLTAALVRAIAARGLRVATIKHAHHDFDIDRDGTDSQRHREAGAGEVLLVSGRRWALMHELRGAPEPTLDDMLERLSPCDLVLVEGYKRAPIPKIEVRRGGEPLAPADPTVIAIVSPDPVADAGPPVFRPERIEDIADFALAHLGLTGARDRRAG